MTEPARYIGVCCREWILAFGGRGRCGLCGETPEYVRPWSDDSVGEALSHLDSTEATAVSVMTGLSAEEIRNLGGLED